MTKEKFDPSRQLVMTTDKLAHGQQHTRNQRLTITPSPSKPGEVDQAMAFRFWTSGAAVYVEDFRPTPVAAEPEVAPPPAEPPATDEKPAADVKPARRSGKSNAEGSGDAPKD